MTTQDRIDAIRAKLARSSPFNEHRADLEWALAELESALEEIVYRCADDRPAWYP